MDGLPIQTTRGYRAALWPGMVPLKAEPQCAAPMVRMFSASAGDPFTDEELPNIASAMGLGFRKIV